MKYEQADDMIKERLGVYLLLDGDEIVYCGKSTHVPSRVWTHVRQGIMVFNHVVVKWCESEQEMNGLEWTLILKYHPKYNIDIGERKTDKGPFTLKHTPTRVRREYQQSLKELAKKYRHTT